MKNKIAVIIGAGPAGLTAALELLEKTDIKPVIYEETGDIGGISKTVNYKGNRIDIGGHRFFSKSQRVMDWWESILPLQGKPAADYKILGEEIPLSNKEGAPDPEKTDRVMLIRKRLSRIFYLGKFFDYPVTLNMNTIRNLGPARIARIGFSYLHARIFPVHEEKSLEDFFINRFGRELYMTFFKDYTEKVWGYPCDKIDSSWGSQRVKGLSLIKTVVHAFGSILFNNNPQSAKGLETSLIGQFHYPKFGPGQLWQEAASRVIEKGGKIHFHRKAVLIRRENSSIKSVEFQNMNTNKRMIAGGDYFLSTMPVRDLIRAMTPEVPEKISSIAGGLAYRDFITAGILVDKLMIRNDTKIRTINDIIPDNWIYIQESGVKVGRLQIFNNWSPYMVNDPRNVWIGMEYF
jgi:protoporphyrinogen oxidase